MHLVIRRARLTYPPNVPAIAREEPARIRPQGVQNMLLAATALGLGATLTTLYLGFEKEAEAAFGLLRGGIPMTFCRSAIGWAASGRFG